MSIIYTPITHFFADPTQLADSVSANYATDAFGPIDTNSYRTTSKVRSITETTVAKVYAICTGRILIQPQTGDDTKINIILKPDESICAPLKIKYFIYRGVRKSDWIDVDNLKPKNLSDNDQSPILQRLWDEYIKSKGAVVPVNFPAASIGYDKTPLTANPDTIDHVLNFIPPGNLPTCKEGELIGNFSGFLGLDIVLDDGDYRLINQNEIFKLDLEFVRKSEHIFDITNISAVVPVDPENDSHNIKKYREYIHRFVDAAAFWGSHIECGTIKLFNNKVGLKTNSEIFNTILIKYQTKNKIYIYIRGKRGRSYNYFFDAEVAERKVKGFNGDESESYSIHGWPILVKEVGISDVEIGLQYSIDQRVYEPTDRYVTIDIIAPNNNTEIYPFAQNIRHLFPTPPKGLNIVVGEIAPKISIKFQINGTNSCASFLFIFGALDQDFPLANYFDDLWLANMDTNQSLPSDSGDLLYCSTYEQNRILNLSGILSTNASIQNQTFFDTGTSISSVTKKRRLSLAIIKETTDHSRFKNLKVSSLKSGFSNKKLTEDLYYINLYNDIEMSVYRGRIVDNIPIYTLSLVHDKFFEQKFKYFHLGITDEDYNKLIFDLAIPLSGSPQLFPKDADNVFFHLEEDTTITGVYFRKFKVGLKYEDTVGKIVIYFPPKSLVYVYTVDGFYFFSPDYSAYQNFYKEFSNCNIGFRPKSDKKLTSDNWAGEFGFDWVRVGDTQLPGDPGIPKTYFEQIGHYYEKGGMKVGPDSINDKGKYIINFKQEISEWIKFSNRFPTYPSGNSLYSSACLVLYPSKDQRGLPTIFPKKNLLGSDKCLTEAGVDLIINIPVSPTKLQIKFETVFFEIVPLNSADLLSVVNKDGYSYLEIVDKTVTPINPRIIRIILKSLNEFTANKTIKILADDKLAGELVVLANEKQFRKETKVALISVKTFINGVDTNIGLDISGKSDIYKIIDQNIARLFDQMLIDVVDLNYKLDFDATKIFTLTSGIIFDFNKIYVDSPGTTSAVFNPKLTPNASIQQDLFDAFSFKNPTLINTLKDYFIIFYINEDAVLPNPPDPSGNVTFTHTNGEALAGLNSQIVCVYQSGIAGAPSSGPVVVNDTSGHELLHAAGLRHTFSDSNTFTFNQTSTDNIMDYYTNGSGKKRYTLSRYQKENIEKHPIIKPEK